MKKYNSSALSNNRSEVLEEAAKNGVIIQEKATNGKVRREFLLIADEPLKKSGHSFQMVKDMME